MKPSTNTCTATPNESSGSSKEDGPWEDVHLACEVGAPAHMGLLADDVYKHAQA